ADSRIGSPEPADPAWSPGSRFERSLVATGVGFHDTISGFIHTSSTVPAETSAGICPHTLMDAKRLYHQSLTQTPLLMNKWLWIKTPTFSTPPVADHRA
ncbi:MAG: hypothetical protein ACREMA_08315, partial [Longimicrobiales bacterium]